MEWEKTFDDDTSDKELILISRTYERTPETQQTKKMENGQRT